MELKKFLFAISVLPMIFSGCKSIADGDIVLSGNVKLEMIKVDAGTFIMGSNETEKGRYDDEMQHNITLTEDYWIGKYEITQKQYMEVMGKNHSHFRGDDLPAENVTWHEAMEFCEKLNRDGKAPSNWKFTLPTEAQWEYAARGGKLSKGYIYSGSNDLDDVGWHHGNSGALSHPAGLKKANELGLHDMSGNVWEWCLDWSAPYSGDAVDPMVGSNGSKRVFRGGSWSSGGSYCRSARRGNYDPYVRYRSLGFRVVLVKK